MRWMLAAAFAIRALGADTTLALPGHPFKLAITKDGGWIFASLIAQARGDVAGLAVIRREGETLRVVRSVPVKPALTGIVLTHDGRTLIGTNGEGVIFFDVGKLTKGSGNPETGAVKEKASERSVYINITRDDQILFVSEEGAQEITVIDAAARSIVGKIAVGRAPIALTFSPDEKFLYTTSQAANWGWPAVCDPEAPGGTGAKHPEGAVVVIDVEKARKDPGHSVVARARAGCNPVRLAISEKGDRAYVTARKSNEVREFDTGKLVSDPDHAQTGVVAVGTAPVPILVVGDRVICGNSNRFGTGGSGDQMLDVIDRNAMKVIDHIPAGQFPRDLILTPDGHSIILANFGSRSIQTIAVPR